MNTLLTTKEDNIPFIAKNIGAVKIGTFYAKGEPFNDHYFDANMKEILQCSHAFQPYEDELQYLVFDPPRDWNQVALDTLTEWRDL